MNKDKIMVILSKIFSSLNLTIRTISAFVLYVILIGMRQDQTCAMHGQLTSL